MRGGGAHGDGDKIAGQGGGERQKERVRRKGDAEETGNILNGGEER